MKTYSYFCKTLSICCQFGLIVFLVSSCGTYQNSSYYDGDGIYGDSENRREVSNKDNTQSAKYQEYFSDLNKDSQAFINIDNYSSVNNDTIDKVENYNSNNSGWGNNPQSITVNVYDNNWGYGYWNNWWYGNYWGMNSWYGPYWGWGWNSWYGPNWGIGWNMSWGSWYGPNYWGGYYNNWCGNNYNYFYNGGRRGSAYTYHSNGNRNDFRNGTRSSNYNANGRSNPSLITGSRNYNTRSSNYPFRSNSYYPTRNNNSSQPTRSNDSWQPTRSNNTESSPVRPYTPTNTRSASFGGGYYGGGSSSGGRSSSGGGRR